MVNRLCTLTLLASLVALAGGRPALGQSQLERALNDMYRICLFGNVEDNPFSRAVFLATEYLGPGLSTYIESNVAAIPLSSTPPGLIPVRIGAETVPAIEFTPLFTESSATVGKGRLYVGSTFSYFDMNRLRGDRLNDLQFSFLQNPGGSDVIFVQMPLGIDVYAYTVFGTFGLTDRLDVGVALPIVQIDMAGRRTSFRIVGDDTGLLYAGTSKTADYDYTDEATAIVPGVDPIAFDEAAAVSSSETFIGALALRAKYQFPPLQAGSVAALVDLRVPVGRDEDNALGEGNFGVRAVLITEHDVGPFRPHLNVGVQHWTGTGNTNLLYAAGLNQRLGAGLFFTFDLLGTLDFETDESLNQIDELNVQFTPEGEFIPLSNIRALDRDHTLNTSLGLRLVLSSRFHLYGTALFSLLDSGLQPVAAPTIGASLIL